MDETLLKRLSSMANTIKYGEADSIDLYDVRGLLNEAASYITDLSVLLPQCTEFTYRRLGAGIVEVHLKSETEEGALPLILEFLAKHF
jgi:hypothetical protein